MLSHTGPSASGVMLQVKPFASVGLITMFISRLPTQSAEFRGGSSGNSDSPCRLICQPCEPSGQGLVMWFRWVSHACVSLPSPLSAPATVPHYTLSHRQPNRQRAWQFLTLEHPFLFFSGQMQSRMGVWGWGWKEFTALGIIQLEFPFYSHSRANITCFKLWKSIMTLFNIMDLSLGSTHWIDFFLETLITFLYNIRLSIVL